MVKLPGAIMQNVTHIAPAVAAFFFTQTIVGFSGAHAPLAYLIGFILVLGLGWCLVQLAQNFPSAGGYFTFASRTLGPSTGFLTGWMFIFYSPIVAGRWSRTWDSSSRVRSPRSTGGRGFTGGCSSSS